MIGLTSPLEKNDLLSLLDPDTDERPNRTNADGILVNIDGDGLLRVNCRSKFLKLEICHTGKQCNIRFIFCFLCHPLSNNNCCPQSKLLLAREC